MGRSGEQMAVVGPNLVEPCFDGGHNVDCVAGAQRSRLGQTAGQQFHLTEYPIGHGNQKPGVVANVLQKVSPQRRGALRSERSLPNFPMDRAGKLRNAQRRTTHILG